MLRISQGLGRGGEIRTHDHLHPMQVRYQAALRPGNDADYIRARLLQTLQKESGAQNVQYLLDIAAHRHGKFIRCALVCIRRLIKTCTGAADGEALLVEQLPNAPDQQDLMVLIVAAVAATLDWLELCELLFPVTQNVRLDATQLAYFTNREVAFCGYWRQLGLTFAAAVLVVAALHRSSSPPSPSVSGWRET